MGFLSITRKLPRFLFLSHLKMWYDSGHHYHYCFHMLQHLPWQIYNLLKQQLVVQLRNKTCSCRTMSLIEGALYCNMLAINSSYAIGKVPSLLELICNGFPFIFWWHRHICWCQDIPSCCTNIQNDLPSCWGTYPEIVDNGFYYISSCKISRCYKWYLIIDIKVINYHQKSYKFINIYTKTSVRTLDVAIPAQYCF